MRKTRAKMLHKLAIEESLKPEYLHMMTKTPRTAMNKIEKTVKSLWYQGKI